MHKTPDFTGMDGMHSERFFSKVSYFFLALLMARFMASPGKLI